MNVNEYISSGILESYIRGEVSDQERREVECLSKIYPEIRAEMDVLERQLESYSREFAQKAPDDLKASIMASIADITPDEPENQKESSAEVKTETQEEEEEEGKVISLPRSRWKPMIAASIILLLGVNIVLFFQFRKANEERKALISQFESLNTSYEEQLAKTEKANQLLDKFEGPESKKVILNSVVEGEEYQMALFWNSNSGEVMVMSEQLPKPVDAKQYQLWALIDGKPVDMGMIDKTGEAWQEMLKTDRADAFAITLEKEGGSPTPTLEQMVVYGEV